MSPSIQISKRAAQVSGISRSLFASRANSGHHAYTIAQTDLLFGPKCHHANIFEPAIVVVKISATSENFCWLISSSESFHSAADVEVARSEAFVVECILRFLGDEITLPFSKSKGEISHSECLLALSLFAFTVLSSAVVCLVKRERQLNTAYSLM